MPLLQPAGCAWDRFNPFRWLQPARYIILFGLVIHFETIIIPAPTMLRVPFTGNAGWYAHLALSHNFGKWFHYVLSPDFSYAIGEPGSSYTNQFEKGNVKGMYHGLRYFGCNFIFWPYVTGSVPGTMACLLIVVGMIWWVDSYLSGSGVRIS